ncbi:hypothetical protein B0T20DRAFT_114090 [Sordaria brevicollis]|uniref:Uncharacterized protein n=1 Tax=Sordaria brevicollis TaxID=83679 RepID=A0AAE0PK66_SORBR|nr:hypothetical protein B0T20DRAFT_114090 [Sordaria brevicollis]
MCCFYSTSFFHYSFHSWFTPLYTFSLLSIFVSQLFFVSFPVPLPTIFHSDLHSLLGVRPYPRYLIPWTTYLLTSTGCTQMSRLVLRRLTLTLPITTTPPLRLCNRLDRLGCGFDGFVEVGVS